MMNYKEEGQMPLFFLEYRKAVGNEQRPLSFRLPIYRDRLCLEIPLE